MESLSECLVFMLAMLAANPAVCSHVSVVSPSLTQLYVKIFMPALPVSLPLGAFSLISDLQQEF